MTWEILLFLTSAIHGVFLSLLFLFRHSDRQRRFLGIYLLAFSLTILYYVNFWTKAFDLPPILACVGAASSWFMPLAFYYYRVPNARLSRLPLHLMAPLAFISYFWVVHFLSPASVPSVLRLTLISTYIGLFVVYGVVVIRRSTETDWLFFLPYWAFVAGLLAYHLSVLLGFYTLRLDYIICGGFVVLTYGITYLGEKAFLRQRVTLKYASSSLTREEGQQLVQKITDSLIRDKSYKDMDFSLSVLAANLSVPKYRISQAFNMYSSVSFSAFVNDLRIREARRMLTDKNYQHYKLEAIGQEVGFRNKVSFYQNFKKIVGESPGEFRDRNSGLIFPKTPSVEKEGQV